MAPETPLTNVSDAPVAPNFETTVFVKKDDFERIVSELKVQKFKGEEAIRHAVVLIDEYQTLFGDSEEALTKLATAVGVTTRTLYRWKKQVHTDASIPPVATSDTLANRIADTPLDGLLRITPLCLREANELVTKWHRHHEAIRVAQFSIGVQVESKLVGAAICMRPACRALDDGLTLEVSRLVSNGTKNACSTLYGTCSRIAKEMGYRKIQTYILESETGTSLKASGWTLEKTACGGTPQGKRTDRPNGHKTTAVSLLKKQRWSKTFADEGKPRQKAAA